MRGEGAVLAYVICTGLFWIAVLMFLSYRRGKKKDI